MNWALVFISFAIRCISIPCGSMQMLKQLRSFNYYAIYIVLCRVIRSPSAPSSMRCCRRTLQRSIHYLRCIIHHFKSGCSTHNTASAWDSSNHFFKFLKMCPSCWWQRTLELIDCKWVNRKYRLKSVCKMCYDVPPTYCCRSKRPNVRKMQKEWAEKKCIQQMYAACSEHGMILYRCTRYV